MKLSKVPIHVVMTFVRLLTLTKAFDEAEVTNEYYAKEVARVINEMKAEVDDE